MGPRQLAWSSPRPHGPLHGAHPGCLGWDMSVGDVAWGYHSTICCFTRRRADLLLLARRFSTLARAGLLRPAPSAAAGGEEQRRRRSGCDSRPPRGAILAVHPLRAESWRGSRAPRRAVGALYLAAARPRQGGVGGAAPVDVFWARSRSSPARCSEIHHGDPSRHAGRARHHPPGGSGGPRAGSRGMSGRRSCPSSPGVAAAGWHSWRLRPWGMRAPLPR